MEINNLEAGVVDVSDCNICYETVYEKNNLITLTCCNNTKKICVKCINCLTTPICPYCRNKIADSCIPYLNEQTTITQSEPVPHYLYSWEDFLTDEHVINPNLYDDSRRLRRQIRRLRYEYQQRVSHLSSRANRNHRNRRNRNNRHELNNFTRQMTRDYNQNNHVIDDFIFQMDN